MPVFLHVLSLYMQVVFLVCAWIALKNNVFANGPWILIGGFGSASLLSTCGLVWWALLPVFM